MSQTVELPPTSLLFKNNQDSNYLDTYVINLSRSDVQSWEAVVAFFNSAPKWMDSLYQFRNKIVALFGLKSDMAKLEDIKPPFKSGQTFGIFKIYDINYNEVILGQDDKHLDFRMSLYIDNEQNPVFIMSTMVIIHNWRGRVYFTIIKPFHKLLSFILSKRMAHNINNKLLPFYELQKI